MFQESHSQNQQQQAEIKPILQLIDAQLQTDC